MLYSHLLLLKAKRMTIKAVCYNDLHKGHGIIFGYS